MVMMASMARPGTVCMVRSWEGLAVVVMVMVMAMLMTAMTSRITTVKRMSGGALALTLAVAEAARAVAAVVPAAASQVFAASQRMRCARDGRSGRMQRTKPGYICVAA